MTSKQDALYWMKWRAVCAAQGWDQKDSERRHAIHIQALGRDKSHKNFNNRDFDRILAQLRLFAEPNSVEARMQADAYEACDNQPQGLALRKYDRMPETDDPGERKRLLYRIHQLFDEPYIIAVCFDQFQTRRWSELPISSLTLLRDTLVNRARARHHRQEIDRITAETVSAEAAALIPACQIADKPDDNCPF
ncbi:MAG: hypothetical protein HY360_07510 [Verrucomicrobia bacterium]|nr:hypothetical protein [Verrucomicrobiota bacterium]